MILVDTSVWIDHLHRTEPRLAGFLAADEVGCHPAIIEELALGSLKNRARVLTEGQPLSIPCPDP
jgi:predicted nucleic acid-binding protein